MSGKSILITGGSGFLGALAAWPKQMLGMRPAQLGLKASVTIDTIIDEHLQDASANA